MPDSPQPIRGRTAEVVAITRRDPTSAKTFRLQLPQPVPHRAGQHFVLRLTAPDGYTAQRSYSVASPPDDSGRSISRSSCSRRERCRASCTTRCRSATSSRSAGRSAVGSCGTRQAGAAPRRWFRRRAADGDAAARARDRAHATWCGSSSRCAPRRSVLPQRVRGRRRRSCTPVSLLRVPRAPRDGSPPRTSSGSVRSDATFYVCGSAGFAEATTQLLVDVGVRRRASASSGSARPAEVAPGLRHEREVFVDRANRRRSFPHRRGYPLRRA